MWNCPLHADWEVAIDPAPLGIILMPGGVDPAGVLVGGFTMNHFDFNVMARFRRFSALAAQSAILRQRRPNLALKLVPRSKQAPYIEG